jgi:hypothetical protein
MAANQLIKPLDTVVLPPEEDKKWAQVVGSLILHFGTLEYLSFLFIGIFSGEAARDAAMPLTFSKRIKLVKKLIKKSNWADVEKIAALKLWSEVAEKCKFRNELAHNPFITKTVKGKNISGILNVRHLRGPGPHAPPLIYINDIILSHNRIGELVLALNATIKPT